MGTFPERYEYRFPMGFRRNSADKYYNIEKDVEWRSFLSMNIFLGYADVVIDHLKMIVVKDRDGRGRTYEELVGKQKISYSEDIIPSEYIEEF